jgi:hypothetical protein
MKTKLEKYINYVVEDLVKNTRIDYDKERIYFPFFSFPYSPSLFLILPPTPHHFPSSSFSKYVQKRYGARDEEMDIIWDQYKERIKSLIKK